MNQIETIEESSFLLTPEELKQEIRLIPDYPKKGVIFKDLAPLYKEKLDLLYAGPISIVKSFCFFAPHTA